MKYIGAHVSAAGGVENAPLNAAKIGANAFALFTKNQRQWQAKPLTPESIEKFKANIKANNIIPEHILPHDSYLINLGNPDNEKRKRSQAALLDEALRAESLGLTLLNLHPGAHLNQSSEDECLQTIAASLNTLISQTEKIIFVIENTAGMGSTVGYSFEHLRTLIELIDDKTRVGVCLDTCHMFAAGYDIRNETSFLEIFSKFDEIVGFEYLKAMHLNDCKTALGSRVDRHHSLGKGELGYGPFRMIMQDKRFDNIPLILETIDPDLWTEEIRALREFC